MATLDGLAAVINRLDLLVTTARSAQIELQAARAEADSITASVSVVEAFVATAKAAADGMTKTRERIEQDAQSVEATATTAFERIRQRMGQFEEQATRLDDLKFRLQGSSNEWDAELKQMIAAVEVGAKSMSDLMGLWGDAMIDGKRLREFLGDMPLDFYQRRMTDLIHGIKEGSKGVTEAITLLKGSQIEFAQSFANLLELFRKGEVTIQAVLEAAQGAAKMFPGSQFAELAEVIAQVSQPGMRF